MFKRLTAFAAAVCAFAVMASAQTSEIRSIFPFKDGKAMYYTLYDASGNTQASYVMHIKSPSGDLQNGSLKIVYNCFDKDMKAFFNSPNEFVMNVSRIEGRTYTEMENVLRLTKLQEILPVGDFSSIPVDMTVGQKLDDSVINIKIDKFKASVTVTDKSVKEHRNITVPAGTFDCWLVHEKTTTRTPFGTSSQSADTWYCEGVGSVKQTVYDGKGRVKCRTQLTRVQEPQVQ